MPRYIIKWNCGYGENAEPIEAANDKAAARAAYERWREDAESNAEYSAEPWTEEEAENHGIGDEVATK